VSWNDDGVAPVLATIGVCDIFLCTGGQQQQTCLQNIGTDDVSLTASVTFVPTANVGPDGAWYFIKWISRTFMDPANPTFPYAAYSAKFTLTGMTGTFNATVQAQINSVAATTAAVSTPAAAATTSAAASGSAAVASVSKAATSASARASASASSNTTSGAVAMTVPGVVSSIAGVTVMMSFASVFLGMLAFGL
jgi:hypothetical protein